MDRKSIFKLRNGNTFYLVSKKDGMVVQIAVQKVERINGFPLVHGNSRVIMVIGLHTSQAETYKDTTIYFGEIGPDNTEFSWDLNPFTTSRKQAMRWAKEGFAMYGDFRQILVQEAPIVQ